MIRSTLRGISRPLSRENTIELFRTHHSENLYFCF